MPMDQINLTHLGQSCLVFPLPDCLNKLTAERLDPEQAPVGSIRFRRTVVPLVDGADGIGELGAGLVDPVRVIVNDAGIAIEEQISYGCETAELPAPTSTSTDYLAAADFVRDNQRGLIRYAGSIGPILGELLRAYS